MTRPAEIHDHYDLDAAGQSLIKAAMRQLNLSARAYHRILKLSRTIATSQAASASRRRTWLRRCSIGLVVRSSRCLFWGPLASNRQVGDVSNLPFVYATP